MGKSKIEKVSYREHLEPLLKCAQRYYGNTKAKKAMCEGAGIKASRYAEWAKEEKKFTSRYVSKILKSLELTPEGYEKETGMSFTKEQIRELRRQKLFDNYLDTFDSVLDVPDLKKFMSAVKKMAEDVNTLEVIYKIYDL